MKTVRNNNYFISILLGLIICLLTLGGLTYVCFKYLFLPSERTVMSVLITIYAVFIYFLFKKTYEIPDFELNENGILLTGRQKISELKWDEISDIDCNQKTFRIANFLKKDWIRLESVLKEKDLIVNNTL